MKTRDKVALFVWGGWEGHQPRQIVERFVPVLESEGYAVSIRSDLDAFVDTGLMRSVDLIVPVMSMDAMTQEQERGLVDVVAQGTGIAAWHGAATFRHNPDLQFVIGGQFVAHPGGIVDYTVTIVRPDDPITMGIQNFSVKSEQYYMHVDPSNGVLATTVFTAEHIPWIAGTVMPVVWKRHWGKGKVFYSSLGHAVRDFEVAEVREIIRRGMTWATR